MGAMVNLRFGLNEAEIISHCLTLESYVKMAVFLLGYIDDLIIIRQCIKECLELDDTDIIKDKSYSSYHFFREHQIHKIKNPDEKKRILEEYCCKIKRLIKKLEAHGDKIETGEKYKDQEDNCTVDPRILLLVEEEKIINIFKKLDTTGLIPPINSNILIGGHIKGIDTITPYNPEFSQNRIRVLKDKIDLVHFFFLAQKYKILAGNSRMLNKLIELHFENNEGMPITSLRQTFHTVKVYEESKILMKMKKEFINIITEALEK